MRKGFVLLYINARLFVRFACATRLACSQRCGIYIYNINRYI